MTVTNFTYELVKKKIKEPNIELFETKCTQFHV